MAKDILSGVVVLERADRLCVSLCGSLLAELGATVLQIAGADHDINLTNVAREKAKQSATIGKTLILGKSATDTTVWQRLAERSDIVLFGYEGPHDRELEANHVARRIVCCFSSFGVDAPSGAGLAGETVLQA